MQTETRVEIITLLFDFAPSFYFPGYLLLLGTEIERVIDGSNELELPFIYTHPGGRIGAFQGRLVQEGRLGLVVTKLDFLTQIKYFCFLTNSPNDTDS